MNLPQSNQPATPQQSAPTTNEAGAPTPSYEERLASVFGDESTDESASEQTTNGATPAQPTGAEKAAQERRARMAEWQAKERERVDAQARHRENETIRQQLADAQRRAKEAEERAARAVDPSKLDEEAWLALGERLEIPPDKIAGWIRERMTNPEAVARRAAAAAVSPEIAALQKKIEEQGATIQTFLTQQQKTAQAAREQAEERAAFHEFVQFAQANEMTAPHAANALANAGPEEFYKLAASAAARVPEGAGPQAILDQIEEDLYDLVKIATARKNAESTQQRQAPTPPNPAAAKAHTTVSNTLAQGRASVVNDETDWSSLTFEERSARLFR